MGVKRRVLPRQVALGTMHGKEAAIAPALARLGVEVVVADVDTDRFGSFSGDVARAGSMLEAARAKARAAAGATGLPVGIASEGAYGPHPYLPFVPVGQEVLLWLDTQTGHEIVEAVSDTDPFYDRIEVTDTGGAAAFLTRVGFPQTGVIVLAGAFVVAKGIRTRAALDLAIVKACKIAGVAVVDTDMRAHMNPHRMGVIAGLAERFAQRLAVPCDMCGAAGFGLVSRLAGLPCDDCGAATGLIAAEIFGCTACGREESRPKNGRADAAHCPICNP